MSFPKLSEARKNKQPKQPKESLYEQLLRQLTELRATILKEENRVGTANTSTLFNDEALEICATTLPKSLLEFQKIEGIGKTRADKWGSRFINLIMDHIEKHPELNEQPKLVTPSKPSPSISDSSNTDSGQKRKIQAAPFQPSKKAAPMPASSNNNNTTTTQGGQPNLKKFAYKSKSS
jgi:ribonuclease D